VRVNELPVGPGEFDADALFAAMDQRRRAEGLSWTGAAKEIWQLSAELNDKRGDHPIAPATLTGIPKRRDTTCQHALFVLRWLGAAPEDFIASPHAATVGVPLPETDSAHRLRWSLVALHTALDESRTDRGATWELLHSEPAHRPAHGQVRDRDAARDAHLPGARPSRRRLRPRLDLVTAPHRHVP
jgi:hypothetical protein